MAERDDVRPVPDAELDAETVEAWERLTAEPELRGVNVARWRDVDDWEWQVEIWVAEFVREEPLEGELRRALDAALRAVPGVTDVAEEDREVWVVAGTPSGEALARAAADIVDAFAERARPLVAAED